MTVTEGIVGFFVALLSILCIIAIVKGCAEREPAPICTYNVFQGGKQVSTHTFQACGICTCSQKYFDEGFEFRLTMQTKIKGVEHTEAKQ